MTEPTEESKKNDKNLCIRFLMAERDPSKRRVKPVEKNLQLLDFGDLGDSSDDSDFKIGEDEQDDSGDDSGETNKDESEEDDESEGEDVKIKDEPVEFKKEMDLSLELNGEKIKLPKLSVGELIDKAMHRQSQTRQRINTDAHTLKVLICSVCLGDIRSFGYIEGNDEIVECDCCGITVHEGCYGISDSETAVSAASSSSTEPWFCDACKAGNMNPICELCPNQGGIFKETDVGRWVHLVCALYITGVAFGDVDKLSPVTLFEMPYSRWGAKMCILCEDDRFSRTGVCISCDAGMCRSFFHVTCAQREGLLSEASTEEIADPFFAYCKLHAEKGIIRSKRCNWLALQSQTKENRLESMPPSEEKSRIERKLAWHRERYNTMVAQKPPPWVPTQKMPRLLTSSSTAYRRLMRKSELFGLNSQNYVSGMDTILDIRKKWHIPAAFNVEFVGYYLDRNTRMVSMQKRLDELLTQNSQLQEEEGSLRNKYEKLLSEVEALKNKGNPMRACGKQFWAVLCDIGNKNLQLPEVLEEKPPPKPPGSKNPRRNSDHAVIADCGLCHLSHDQHQLAKCDKCRLYYHLACLDPPLTRMPKKTKSQGWQCSECDKTEEEERLENAVDPDAPRRLRDHSNDQLKRRRLASSPEPPPTTSKASARRGRPSRKLLESRNQLNTSSEVEDTAESVADEEEEDDDPSSREKITLTIRRPLKRKGIDANSILRGKNKKGKKRKMVGREATPKSTKEENDKELSPSPGPSSKGNRVLPTRKTRSDIRSNCCRCGEVGENATLVKCDECKKCYHFGCLRPPVKKSPKQRGYTWHCEECDSSDEEKDVTEVKESPKAVKENPKAVTEPITKENIIDVNKPVIAVKSKPNDVVIVHLRRSTELTPEKTTFPDSINNKKSEVSPKESPKQKVNVSPKLKTYLSPKQKLQDSPKTKSSPDKNKKQSPE